MTEIARLLKEEFLPALSKQLTSGCPTGSSTNVEVETTTGKSFQIYSTTARKVREEGVEHGFVTLDGTSVLGRKPHEGAMVYAKVERIQGEDDLGEVDLGSNFASQCNFVILDGTSVLGSRPGASVHAKVNSTQ